MALPTPANAGEWGGGGGDGDAATAAAPLLHCPPPLDGEGADPFLLNPPPPPRPPHPKPLHHRSLAEARAAAAVEGSSMGTDDEGAGSPW
mgnify:CR=1 FL=1